MEPNQSPNDKSFAKIERKLIRNTRGNAWVVVGGGCSFVFTLFAIFTALESAANDGFWVLAIICAVITVFCAIRYFHPKKHHIYAKYGDSKAIAQMISEALNGPKLVEDKRIFVTDKYFLFKPDYTSIRKTDDILELFFYDTNSSIAGAAAAANGMDVRTIGIKIIDKWGESFFCQYDHYRADEIYDVIQQIIQHHPNIRNTHDPQYVSENAEPLN